MAEKSAIAADFMPQSPSLSLCFPLLYKSPTLFPLITQIGFPGDKGRKRELQGVLDIVLVEALGSDLRSHSCIHHTPDFTI